MPILLKTVRYWGTLLKKHDFINHQANIHFDESLGSLVIFIHELAIFTWFLSGLHPLKGKGYKFFFFFDAFNILWAKGGLLILIFLWNCPLIPVLRPISEQKQCSASAHSRFSSNSGLKPIKLLIFMFQMITISKICPLEVLFRLFDQIFLGPKLFK